MREGSWCGSIRAAGGMAGSLSCRKLMYMYMLIHCIYMYMYSALTTVMCECSEWADVYMCTCTYKVAIT